VPGAGFVSLGNKGGGIAAVGQSNSRPAYASVSFDSVDGVPGVAIQLDPGEPSSFTAVRGSRVADNFAVAVGTILQDILIAGLDASGTPLAAIRIEAGGEEFANAMDRIVDADGNEYFVLAGSTDAYFDNLISWLVIVFSWDGAGSVVVEKAMAIRPDDIMLFQAPHAILALDPVFNYWGRDGLFLIAGDGERKILMDISGDVLWASAGSVASFLNGRIRGVAANNNTDLGFYTAGTALPDPELLAFEDGTVSWVMPEDGVSHPHTASTTNLVRVQDITADLVYPAVSFGPNVPIAGATGIPEYPLGTLEDLTVFDYR